MARSGMPHHRGAVLSAVASGALFGTARTAAAFAPATASPLGIGWVRIAGGALVLTVVTGLLGRRLGEIRSAVRRPLLWVAAAGAAGYQVCFFAATRNASVALATLVAVGSAPLFSGFLGRLTLGHRLPDLVCRHRRRPGGAGHRLVVRDHRGRARSGGRPRGPPSPSARA